MTHIETLIMNQVRKSLESLEEQGVGFIDEEFSTKGEIHYNIDNATYMGKVVEDK